MNRNAKIGIAAIVGLVLLAICACIGAFVLLGRGLVKSVVTDAEQIAQLRQEIIDYTAPEGYTEIGLRLLGFKALMMSDHDRSPETFIIMSFPSDFDISQDEIDQAMQQVNQQDQATAWQVVETQTVSVAGQEVDLVTLEGSSVDGFTRRKMQCAISGSAGLIAIQIEGNTDGWDQTLVDTFLASLR